jgi:cytochrome P450
VAAGGVEPEHLDLMRHLVAPANLADPYPLYAEIRSATALRLPTGELAFGRYTDVTTIVKDPRFGKPPQPRIPFGPARTLFRMPLLLDPPDHTRLRRIVVPLFLPAATASWRQAVIACSDRLLPTGTADVDLVASYSYELPLAVICEMLAVPDHDRPSLATWSRAMTASLDAPPPRTLRDMTRAARDVATRRARPIHAIRSAVHIVRYAKRHLDRLRPEPPNQLVEVLVRARRDGDLNDDEAAALWIMLLIAGHETTANLIGLSVQALTGHPDVLGAIRADAEAADRLVDECVRYDCPVPFTPRVALEDLELGGVHVARGQTVLALFAAANRDPDAFPDPDHLDLDRPSSPPHLGFGAGIHFCLGSALARLETDTALRALAPRLQGPATHVAWRELASVRGPSRLVVRLDDAQP